MDFRLRRRRFRLVHRFAPGGKKASVQIETVLPRTDAFTGLPASGSLPAGVYAYKANAPNTIAAVFAACLSPSVYTSK